MLSKDRRKIRANGPNPGLHIGVYLVSGFFLMMLSIICALSLFYNGTLPFSLPEFIDPDESFGIFRRRLANCYPDEWYPEYHVIWMILCIMYIFIAIAVVCDEFFVPALEVISEKLNLAPDVAGATLMAAGGSAPELFTNIFATFERSDAGFGTIIGSAVFNVLFVIGMCAMFSKNVLQLTWWPLARDCIFYTFGLAVVALFVGANSRNKIEIWESVVLFLMYFVYIFLMYWNRNLKEWVSGKKFGNDVVPLEEPEMVEKRSYSENGAETPIKHEYTSMIGRQLSFRGTNFRVPGTFRVGIQYLMLGDEQTEMWVSTRAVLDMAGDVRETFDHLDKNHDEKLDESELKALLNGMFQNVESVVCQDEEVAKLMKKLDKNDDGFVDYEEFAKWYIGSAERIKRDINNLFKRFDTDGNDMLEKSELRALLNETDKMEQSEIDSTVAMLFENKPEGEGIHRDQFFLWYNASDLFKNHCKEADRHRCITEGFKQLFEWPEGNFQRFWYCLTLPLMILFYFSMADVRQISKQKYCYVTFMMSIVWIGVFAYAMVTLAIAIGDTVRIPNYIMGMTFLAAGTSIPDLLSSVIVARQGQGDMAVSSSIGSNIFDILVGLPLPWILFSWINQETVNILSCELAVSILVLIAMLISVVIAIKLSKWELSRRLGYSMFGLYFVFLTQDLIRNFTGDPCDPSC